MNKLSKENKEQLKKIFHCVNFLIYLKEIMLKEDDKDGLEAHPGFERRLGNHIDIFQKKKSFNNKELIDFMELYNFFKGFYEADYMKQEKGEPFHIEFDYSPKTKDE